jgi:Icc-related predicted phosphoesterase
VRYLIISDIHANIDALEAVLERADGAWDRLLVLGDLVGYGAEPNLVIDTILGLSPPAGSTMGAGSITWRAWRRRGRASA